MISQANTLQNFIAIHKGFCDPSIVLNDNVTLYAVNQREAVFVECDDDITVTSVMKPAQYQRARRLIILPIHSVHRLAAQKAKLLMLPNTTRCGSTLLCQIFEKTGKCLALAEPEVMRSFYHLAKQWRKQNSESW